MDLNMEIFEKSFVKAVLLGCKYVGVYVRMEGFPESELIVNKQENFEAKLAYYKKTYDENLNHKFSKGIRIVGVAYADSLNELEAPF